MAEEDPGPSSEQGPISEGDLERLCARYPEIERTLRSLWAGYPSAQAAQDSEDLFKAISERLSGRGNLTVDLGSSPGVQAQRDGSAEAPSQGEETESTAGKESFRGPGTGRGERYTPREEIGRGGMGAVLRVWDSQLHRHLAMKVLLAKEGVKPDKDLSESLTRFLEEAQVTAMPKGTSSARADGLS